MDFLQYGLYAAGTLLLQISRCPRPCHPANFGSRVHGLATRPWQQSTTKHQARYSSHYLPSLGRRPFNHTVTTGILVKNKYVYTYIIAFCIPQNLRGLIGTTYKLNSLPTGVNYMRLLSKGVSFSKLWIAKKKNFFE